MLREQDRSSASLARLVGCSRQTIAKLRNGKATGTGLTLAASIERTLGLNVGTLFAITETVRKGLPTVEPEVTR